MTSAESRRSFSPLRDVVTWYPAGDLSHRITSGSDGNLGSEILRRFVNIFDFGRAQLHLVPTDRLAEPFRFSTSGVRLRSHREPDGTLVVDEVTPGSPGDLVGLRQGDVVVGVDGKAVQDLEIEAVVDLLRQDPGQKVSLRVRRGEADEELALRLARLL